MFFGDTTALSVTAFMIIRNLGLYCLSHEKQNIRHIENCLEVITLPISNLLSYNKQSNEKTLTYDEKRTVSLNGP